ncbi:MAG: Rrf2 family transcriptional regulator [Tetrasphaera sp.]
MKLQTATRLGVYAVLDLAASPLQARSVTEIAERRGVSVNHLSKVMRTLAAAGLVEGARGVGGGYRFVGNAKRLTLLEVIELFEDPVGESSRILDAQLPDVPVLDQILREIDDVTRLTLDSISIATMIRLSAELVVRQENNVQ